jgi:cell division protein FtsQ
MRLRLRPFLRRFRTDLVHWTPTVSIVALVIAAVTGLAYGTCVYAWPAIRTHPYFRLRSVKITCDSAYVKPSVLASRAGLYDGTSLWDVDVDSARAALEAAPWVREARVERHFPDHVSLQVYRRQPIAATMASDGPYLIGDDGVVYREERPQRYSDLPDVPYLTGWERAASHGDSVVRLRSAMALLRAATSAGITVSQVDVGDDGTLWLFPETPRVAVRFGRDADLTRAMVRLQTVLATLPRETHDLEEIDLTYADRAVVRVKDGRVHSVLSEIAASNAVAGLAGTRTATLGQEGDRG